MSDLLEKPSQKTQVLSEKTIEVQKLFGSDYKTEEHLWSFLEEKDSKKLIPIFNKYLSLRPSAERSYDQFTATVETVAKRCSLMNFLKDIAGKKLAFIGDDDFTSVVVALRGKPKKITVFEIDKRIIEVIKEISEKESLKIEVLKYDARKRVPAGHFNSYDVVFTDPPYTTYGISLFISRGIELLDKESDASRIYVCYGNSDRAKERVLPIQKLFFDSGLMLRYVFDKFNRYTGAESIGSASSLYIADVSPLTRSTIQGEFNEEIYTI